MNRIVYRSLLLRTLFLFLLVQVLSWNLGWAQRMSQVDSLKTELRKAKDDVAKINILNALSAATYSGRNDTVSYRYAVQALNLSEPIDYKRGLGYAHLRIGLARIKGKMRQDAMNHYNMAHEFFNQANDWMGAVLCYRAKANFETRPPDYAASIKYLLQADSLCRIIHAELDLQADTLHALILHDLAYYSNSNGAFIAAREYGNQCIALAEKLHFKRGLAYGYQAVGFTDAMEGKYPACLEHNTKSLEWFLAWSDVDQMTEYADQKKVTFLYARIGRLTIALKQDINTGLSLLQKSMSVCEQIGDSSRLAEVLYELGRTNKSYLQDMVEATRYFFQAIRVSEATGNKYVLGKAHYEIGRIVYKDNNLEEADKHFKLAYSLLESIGKKLEMADVLFEIGRVQAARGEPTAVVSATFFKLKELSEELRDTNLLILAVQYLIDLGTIEYTDDVLQLLEKQNREWAGLNDIVNLQNGYLNTSIAYDHLGEYDKAEEYALKSWEIAVKHGMKSQMASVLKALKEIKFCQGHYPSAYGYQELYNDLKDSFNLESAKEAIAKFQVQYDTEKKDKEILRLASEKEIANLELKLRMQFIDRMSVENKLKANEIDLLHKNDEVSKLKLAQTESEVDAKNKEVSLLNKEAELHKLTIRKQEQTRNYLLGGIGLFLLLSLFVYSNYLTRQQLKLQKLRNKIAMDLHDDVGSTLSSISIFSEMARQQSKEVSPMLDTIGESSRKMLDAMADIVWTINPENDQFEKIILRMRGFAYQLLGTKNIHFEFEVDEGVSKIRLPMDTRKNLYLIFKEATNNMVKYADANLAYFSIKEENRKLTMLVQDNGKGFDVNEAKEGNGLRNMKKRAEEIGGQLWIESKRDLGTTITLSVAV